MFRHICVKHRNLFYFRSNWVNNVSDNRLLNSNSVILLFGMCRQLNMPHLRGVCAQIFSNRRGFLYLVCVDERYENAFTLIMIRISLIHWRQSQPHNRIMVDHCCNSTGIRYEVNMCEWVLFIRGKQTNITDKWISNLDDNHISSYPINGHLSWITFGRNAHLSARQRTDRFIHHAQMCPIVNRLYWWRAVGTLLLEYALNLHSTRSDFVMGHFPHSQSIKWGIRLAWPQTTTTIRENGGSKMCA